jgi:hypothetical protein
MDYAHDIRLYCDPNDIIVTSRSFFFQIDIDFTKSKTTFVYGSLQE